MLYLVEISKSESIGSQKKLSDDVTMLVIAAPDDKTLDDIIEDYCKNKHIEHDMFFDVSKEIIDLEKTGVILAINDFYSIR